MKIKAWHFSTGKLAFGDNRKITKGSTFTCEPDSHNSIESGFHASRKLIDALNFAPGSILSYVECVGNIAELDDKLVCSEHTHLIVVDVDRTLHEFAIWCASQALLLIENPGHRSIAAIEAKKKWLNGEITDSELVAAGADARADARAAAEAATGAASRAAAGATEVVAGEAARDAAGAAALAAAGAASRAAARNAAWVAARADARAAQQNQLNKMILALPEFAGIEFNED